MTWYLLNVLIKILLYTFVVRLDFEFYYLDFFTHFGKRERKTCRDLISSFRNYYASSLIYYLSNLMISKDEYIANVNICSRNKIRKCNCRRFIFTFLFLSIWMLNKTDITYTLNNEWTFYSHQTLCYCIIFPYYNNISNEVN